MLPNSDKAQQGFTIIELLVVIALIGLLSGIAMVVINPQSQEDFARDSVRRQHISDLADSLETYYTAEREYPDDSTAANRNPLDASGDDDEIAAVYIEEWPVDVVYTLAGDTFSVHIVKASDGASYFKYNSDWQEIRECTDVSGVGTCL